MASGDHSLIRCEVHGKRVGKEGPLTIDLPHCFPPLPNEVMHHRHALMSKKVDIFSLCQHPALLSLICVRDDPSEIGSVIKERKKTDIKLGEARFPRKDRAETGIRFEKGN